jgi:voltage-gated sodium channel
MSEICRKIEKSRYFHHVIVLIIILAGILIGIDTYPSISEGYSSLLSILNKFVLIIFSLEIVIRITAYGNKPWRFFKDGWNVFDFIIVLICILPINGQFLAILRLARVLRIMRLVTSLPKLQVLVSALFKSIPSMGYISLLLFLLFYVYAVFGTYLFRDNDPVHFGNLQTSLLTMFRVVTLEDWTDILYINMYGSDQYAYENIVNIKAHPKAMPFIAPLFFVSFVLIGTMVIMNLFIGIIMNGMQEAHKEQQFEVNIAKSDQQTCLHADLHLLTEKIDSLREQIDLISYKVKAEDKKTKPPFSK